MSQSKKGLLLVIFSGLVFGVQPSLVSYCYTQGANPTLLLILRFAVILVLLFPVMLKEGHMLQLFRRYWRKLLLISCASAGTPLLLFNSYRYMATGLATSLHFMYPTVVALICLIFYRERLSGPKRLSVGLCLGGMLVLLDTSQGLNGVGVALALTSSVTYSLYIVWLDKLDLEGLNTTQILFFVELINLVLVGGIYGTLTGSLAVSVTASGWVTAVAASLVIAVGGHLFFLIGVRYAGAQTAAIASTLEPITSIFIGILFMNEPFGPRTAIGAIMILAAVVLLSVFDEKNSPKADV